MSERGGVAGGHDKIRVCVVGAGEFGRNHARVYREMANVELVGVVDENTQRADLIAQEFGIRAFKGIAELEGAVDAASVAVPTVSHAEVGCRLMAMGIDVLVEKPMAASLTEADSLLTPASILSQIQSNCGSRGKPMRNTNGLTRGVLLAMLSSKSRVNGTKRTNQK